MRFVVDEIVTNFLNEGSMAGIEVHVGGNINPLDLTKPDWEENK